MNSYLKRRAWYQFTDTFASASTDFSVPIGMPKTGVVATLGPQSTDPAMLHDLIVEGVNVFRLNFSHKRGKDEDAKYAQLIALIRDLSRRLMKPVYIMADIQGPKIRLGDLVGSYTVLENDQVVTIVSAAHTNDDRIPLNHEPFVRSLAPQDHLLIGDGEIELVVTQTSGDQITCKVLVGGELGSRKGVAAPHANLIFPAITPKDQVDIQFALEHGVDFFAMSFVRTADDIRALQALVGAVPILAKIELPAAVDNLSEIIEVASAVMVARGDLGLHLPLQQVALHQKHIISESNQADKLVITATEMMISMVNSPRPTRAEVSDVTNAILDGTNMVMLSNETAMGSYPVESIRWFLRIIREVEQYLASYRPGDIAA